MHLFGRNRDHDYYFGLLSEEEQDAQSITLCSAAHHRDVRAVPKTRLASREALYDPFLPSSPSFIDSRIQRS